MVAAKGSALKRPVRWYSIPRLFRYEKMQKGRLREFFQLNMDILGVADVSADAELIAAVIDMMRDLGFTADDFKVRISSRTLLEELFTAAGLEEYQIGELYKLLDKKNKISDQDYHNELGRIICDKNARDRVLQLFQAGSLDELKSVCGETTALIDLQKLFELIGFYGFSEYAVFDIGIVRGLAYYTGIVFEVFDIKKSMRAIAGGGRYDKLVELYDGPTTPAVGFAAGDVVLGELLKEKGLLPPLPPRSEIFIITIDEILKSEMIETAQKIRDKGISCEFSLKESNMGKQLKSANAARSLFTLFLGGEEKKNGNVKIKNMNTGTEETVSEKNIADYLLKMLKK
jgi:histidyl-tRNA synthetase